MNNLCFEIHRLESLPSFYEQQSTSKHLQKSFEFVWVEEGTGFHIIDECHYPLQANRLFCIAHGRYHQLVIHPGTRGFLVSFTENFLQQQKDRFDGIQETILHRQFIQAPELPVDPDSGEQISDILSLLLKERQRNPFIWSDTTFMYLKIFMVHFAKQLKMANAYTISKTMNELVDNFLSLLEKSFKERRTVSDYAKALFVTPNHLNFVIKTTTGFTARHHIQQRVLLEAKMELQRKGASMKQIAYHLGFDDMGHFSKFFKNTAGENFSSFRKQIKERYASA